MSNAQQWRWANIFIIGPPEGTGETIFGLPCTGIFIQNSMKWILGVLEMIRRNFWIMILSNIKYFPSYRKDVLYSTTILRYLEKINIKAGNVPLPITYKDYVISNVLETSHYPSHNLFQNYFKQNIYNYYISEKWLFFSWAITSL